MVASLFIRRALRYLNQAGVIAYPTEAVWGLGCDPLNPQAVLRLLQIKQRPMEKGLILIAADWQQLKSYVANLDPVTEKKINQTWPGPVTWVVPVANWVPDYLTGGRDTIAIRVSDHDVVRDLCQGFAGPIVSTSANISQRPAVRRSWQLRKLFLNKIDFIVPGALGGLKSATPIRNALSNQILRN
ncbi:MAG: L-threonylcarbamoyladenylate synthase [Gammaproteobacteria bacterium]|nr:L-threonylcarbamoyladenylate synthase [Gammaproteobacteria bacterium]MDH5727794.1 L-threonylcarbamoyladenylate synthase [Gammaproteobacteria bacterium]